MTLQAEVRREELDQTLSENGSESQREGAAELARIELAQAQASQGILPELI